jgi:integrase
MPQLLLTDLSIRALSSERRVDYWDTKTPGFGIRVGPRGKTFILKQGGTRRTVGAYPAVTLQEARKKAFAFKAEGTPAASANLTFKAAYDKFADQHIPKKKPRTQYDYKRVLDKYFLPELENIRLSKITYDRIIKITDVLADVPYEQAHVLAVARCFFRWCLRPPRRYISHSPLEGIQLIMGKRRKRVLNDQELVAVWRAAEAQGYPHGTVIQLLILFGQRKSETGAFSWPWINERERTITIPDTITKNKTEHTFPYGELAHSIIEKIPRRNRSAFLFPSRYEDDAPFSGWSKFKTELNDGCAHWTLHDLRRTFRTGLGRLGVAPHIAERMVNHISSRSEMEETYDLWTYLPEMRAAMEKWEAHLLSLFAQEKVSQSLRGAA